MDYESSAERLPTNHTKRNSGKNLPEAKIAEIEELLKQGMGVTAVCEKVKVSNNSVIGIKKRMEDANKFDHGTWKRNTAKVMSEIVTRGSQRLLTEIDNIPVGSLPLAIAIITDKAMQLQDAPSVIVEHRLKVKHEDINAMIRGDIIDVPAVEKKD